MLPIRHTLRRPAAALAAVLLAACTDALAPDAATGRLPGVRVTPTAATYAAGQAVTLDFRNGSVRTLEFNPCFRRLERQVAAEPTGWRAVDEGDRVCPAYAIVWARGRTIRATTELPTPLSAGRYRFVFRVNEPAGDSYHSLTQASEPFTVSP